MLKVRQEQMDQLQEAVLREVENRMLAHAGEYFPDYFKSIGEERMRGLARQALRRASACGMVTEASATLFLDLMLAEGIQFDEDPQLPFVAGVLNDPSLENEEARAEALHRESMECRTAVAGEKDEHFLAALQRMRQFTLDRPPASAQQVVAQMQSLYPQKCAHLGDAVLEELVGRAVRQAAESGLRTPAGVTLLSAMMLLAGSGVVNDPRFPLVQEALADRGAADAAARVARVHAAVVREIERQLAGRS